jgi:AcrR family transcriptional regulator
MRKEQKAQMRENILTAARRLFQEQGFDGTSMTTIALASGLSVGGIYLYFKNKDDVFAHVFGRSLRDARLEVERNIINAAVSQ